MIATIIIAVCALALVAWREHAHDHQVRGLLESHGDERDRLLERIQRPERLLVPRHPAPPRPADHERQALAQALARVGTVSPNGELPQDDDDEDIEG